MKINTPLKFALLICLIISFFVILYSYLATFFNPIIVGSFLFVVYFSTTYYLLKYQFYEKVKIIYKNILFNNYGSMIQPPSNRVFYQAFCVGMGIILHYVRPLTAVCKCL